jgi:hypothetical protein
MFLCGWREWLKQAFQAGRRSPGRRPFRPRLEGLEPRWTPDNSGFEFSPFEVTASESRPTGISLFPPEPVDAVNPFPGPDSAYAATINWGDGTSSPGTVRRGISFGPPMVFGGGAGPGQGEQTLAFGSATLTVSGSHVYTDEGPFEVSALVTRNGSPFTTVTTTATVQEELKPDGTVGTPTERFVQEVYRDLLGRGLDPTGDAIWVGLLNGGASRAQVALDIERSPERRRNEVQALYLTLLNRFADDATVANATFFLNTGGTLDQVRAVIAGSPEYFDKHGGSNDAFVTAVYSDFLHAAADPTTRNAIDTALASHTMTRQQVVATLLNTDAFRQVLVVGYFQEFLARSVDPTDPGPAGGKGYVDALRAGLRDEQVLAGIMGTQEYYDRVAL